jgi:lipoprotein-anchoring transpeptidase ErfK/SrfK
METAQLIQQAETALRKNNVAEARSLLRQVIHQDPRDDHAWLLLARTTTDAKLADEYINRARSLQQAAPLREPRQDGRSSSEKNSDRRSTSWQYGLLALAVVLLIAVAALSIAGRPRQQAIALQDDERAQVVSSVVERPSGELDRTAQPQAVVQSEPNRATSQVADSALITATEAPPRTTNKVDTAGMDSVQTQENVTPEPEPSDESDLALPAAILSGLESEALSAGQAQQTAGSEDPNQAETQATGESSADRGEEVTSAFADDNLADAEELQDLRELETAATAVLPGDENSSSSAGSGERWIDVNLTTQTLVAYEGDTPVLNSLVSSGMWQFPTVTGQFHTYMKLETQNMSGYHLGYNYYLEDVPYVMYFYEDYALHGAYWHNNFGTPMSHGCVNMNIADAGWIFDWAPLGTLVNVHY